MSKGSDLIVRIGVVMTSLVLMTAPLVAKAQAPGRVYRLGVLHVGTDHIPPSVHGLQEGLAALGYDVGRTPLPKGSAVIRGANAQLDWRNVADEAAARTAARQFTLDSVDIIVAFEDQAVRASQAATSKIPVVFLHVNAPVEEGFVRSLARPGGNLTGLAEFRGELLAKRLEMFKELMPSLSGLLVLFDPDDPIAGTQRQEIQRAAARLKIEPVERSVIRLSEIDQVFAALKPQEIQGVFVLGRLVTNAMLRIIPRATERRLAVAAQARRLVSAGALFSYGVDSFSTGRDAARYADKILKGTSPRRPPHRAGDEIRVGDQPKGRHSHWTSDRAGAAATSRHDYRMISRCPRSRCNGLEARGCSPSGR